MTNEIHHQQRKQIQGGCEYLLEQGVVSEWKNQSDWFGLPYNSYKIKCKKKFLEWMTK